MRGTAHPLRDGVDALRASAHPENPQTWNRYSYVINRLSQLRKAGTKDETDKVAIAFVLCNLDFEDDANKEVIVPALMKEPHSENSHSDWEAGLIGRLIRRRNKNRRITKILRFFGLNLEMTKRQRRGADTCLAKKPCGEYCVGL